MTRLKDSSCEKHYFKESMITSEVVTEGLYYHVDTLDVQRALRRDVIVCHIAWPLHIHYLLAS